MQIFSLSEATPLLKVAFSPVVPKGDLLVRFVLVIDVQRHGSRSVRSESVWYSTQNLHAEHCRTKQKGENPRETFNDQAYMHSRKPILTMRHYDVSVCRLEQIS